MAPDWAPRAVFWEAHGKQGNAFSRDQNEIVLPANELGLARTFVAPLATLFWASLHGQSQSELYAPGLTLATQPSWRAPSTVPSLFGRSSRARSSSGSRSCSAMRPPTS